MYFLAPFVRIYLESCIGWDPCVLCYCTYSSSVFLRQCLSVVGCLWCSMPPGCFSDDTPCYRGPSTVSPAPGGTTDDSATRGPGSQNNVIQIAVPVAVCLGIVVILGIVLIVLWRRGIIPAKPEPGPKRVFFPDNASDGTPSRPTSSIYEDPPSNLPDYSPSASPTQVAGTTIIGANNPSYQP